MLSSMDSVRPYKILPTMLGKLTILYRRLLVQHPPVLFKLRHEIKDAIGVGPAAHEPTINQLKKLPYLLNVIKEGSGLSTSL